MGYSDTAIAFSTIPVGQQVRLEDRVSFAYLEYVTVVQDRTGVVALSEEDGQAQRQLIQIPVSGLAVLLLGPGTSITQPAITSCTRAGATVMFTGGGGIPAYSHATPLTSSARWAIAQAKVVSNHSDRLAAAKLFYKRQLGIDDMPGGSIRVLRGIEGRTIRDTYRECAQKYKAGKFKRDVAAEDRVNIALNLANSILYGCAAAACAAIGVNPALGIIHNGDARSLLYDLADLFKPSLTIPLAFRCAATPDLPEMDQFLQLVRTEVRKALRDKRVLQVMLAALMEILEPHLPGRDDDRLIGDEETEVAGHRQYGTGPGEEAN